jgi:hypothetical protein
MSDDYAARFRKQAEECREHAAKAVNPIDKEAWLRLAEEWLKMGPPGMGRTIYVPYKCSNCKGLAARWRYRTRQLFG